LIVSNKVTVTIVLDALDECIDAKTLAKELLKFTNETAVKVVLTARKEGKYVELFAKSTPTLIIEISHTDIDHDITSFVTYKIMKIERLSGQENEELRNRVVNKLCDPKSHQGMFLWAYLMCKDIKDRSVFSTGPDAIGQFPRGLGGVYERILDKFNRLPEMHQQFCRLILQWVVCSSRPLQFAELEHALRLSQRSSTDYFEKVDGGSYQLCFSRKDIVRVCGSLVSYTGLADGDTIGLIHLSARDFLSRASGKREVPLHLSSFVVNVPKSKTLLCLICLDVLLDKSLHADPYFRGRENLIHEPMAQDNAFRERHPLFEYAVRYWPELAWDALTSQLANETIVNVNQKITAFIESGFSVFWAESFVSRYRLEFFIFNMKRFRRLSSLLSKALPWVDNVLSTLKIYDKSINHSPRSILSLMNTQTHVRRTVNEARKTQALWQDGSSAHFPEHHTDLSIPRWGWVHYDVCTDSLFYGPQDSERRKLDRWIVGEEMKFCPAVYTGMPNSSQSWHLCSAALSLCSQYIAITYTDSVCLQTLLWKIDPQPERTAAADWAELCLVDQHDIVMGNIFRNELGGSQDVVSFGRENTVNAPGGIWNIISREKVSRPTAIYDPEASLGVSCTCFGMDRVARVLHNDELEILDMDGNPLLRHEFRVNGGVVGVRTVKFSRSARKLVFRRSVCSYRKDETTPVHDSGGLYCFLLEENVLVRLSNVEWFGRAQVQFVHDENAIVVSDGAFGSILVYALPNGIGSNGHEEVPGTCIFRTTNIVTAWCIPPTVTADAPGLLLLTQDFGLQKRQLDHEWTKMEDRDLMDVVAAEIARDDTVWYPIKQGTQWVSIQSPFVNGQGTSYPAGKFVLTVSTWRCGHQLERGSTVTIQLQTLNSLGPRMMPRLFHGRPLVSCNGKYIVTQHGLFQSNQDSLTLVDLHLAGEIEITESDFSQDENRFAVIYLDRMSNKYILSVYELCPNQSTTVLAKKPCQSKRVSVAFHPIDTSLLIISSANDNHGYIRIAKVCDAQLKWMELWSGSWKDPVCCFIPSFSSCGNYVTVDLKDNDDGNWPQLKAHQYAVPEQGKTYHPSIFVRDEVCSPDMYRLRVRGHSSLVYLEHKLLASADHEYRIRVLCVLPETYKIFGMPMLIWSLDDADDDEVKFSTVGTDLIIGTGIRSRDLLNGDEWIANEDINQKWGYVMALPPGLSSNGAWDVISSSKQDLS